MLYTNYETQMPEGSETCPSCGLQTLTAPTTENAMQAQVNPAEMVDAQAQPLPMETTDAQTQHLPMEAADAQAQVNPPAGSVDAQTPDAEPAFANARRGLNNMFLSQAVMVASSAGIVLLSFIGPLAAMILGGASYNAVGVAAMLIGIFALFLMLVALAMRLVGLYQASKDESFFKSAFIITIFLVVLSFVSEFISNSSLNAGSSLGTSVLSIAVFVLIFRGIVSIADKAGKQEIASSGKEMLVGAIVCYIVSIIILVLVAISGTGSFADAVLSLAAVILAFVPDILLLTLLSRAKKMFI